MIGTSIEFGPFKLSLDLAENQATIDWVGRPPIKCGILDLKFLGGNFDLERSEGFGLTLMFSINDEVETFVLTSENRLLKYTSEVGVRSINRMLNYIHQELEVEQLRLMQS